MKSRTLDKATAAQQSVAVQSTDVPEQTLTLHTSYPDTAAQRYSEWHETTVGLLSTKPTTKEYLQVERHSNDSLLPAQLSRQRGRIINVNTQRLCMMCSNMKGTCWGSEWACGSSTAKNALVLAKIHGPLRVLLPLAAVVATQLP